MLYRLIFIGIVFLGIEWVSNNPNSKFKVPIGIFSVFGLFYSIAFVFIPFYEEYLEIIGIISTVLAIVLFKILLDKSIRIKLIILVIISSIDFGMIHGLERFPSTFIAGLFFAILFINRAKLEFWDDFTNRLSKIKHLLFGYLTVYFIHLYNNFIIIMFSNNLEMSWICLLILSGVALLVYGSQIIFSKVEERGI